MSNLTLVQYETVSWLINAAEYDFSRIEGLRAWELQGDLYYAFFWA